MANEIQVAQRLSAKERRSPPLRAAIYSPRDGTPFGWCLVGVADGDGYYRDAEGAGPKLWKSYGGAHRAALRLLETGPAQTLPQRHKVVSVLAAAATFAQDSNGSYHCDWGAIERQSKVGYLYGPWPPTDDPRLLLRFSALFPIEGKTATHSLHDENLIVVEDAATGEPLYHCYRSPRGRIAP